MTSGSIICPQKQLKGYWKLQLPYGNCNHYSWLVSHDNYSHCTTIKPPHYATIVCHDCTIVPPRYHQYTSIMPALPPLYHHNWLVVSNMFIFHNIWDNHSHWLIFFKIVKTTNQIISNITIYEISSSYPSSTLWARILRLAKPASFSCPLAWMEKPNGMCMVLSMGLGKIAISEISHVSHGGFV